MSKPPDVIDPVKDSALLALQSMKYEDDSPLGVYLSCACHVPAMPNYVFVMCLLCVLNVPVMCLSCACHVPVMCLLCAYMYVLSICIEHTGLLAHH